MQQNSACQVRGLAAAYLCAADGTSNKIIIKNFVTAESSDELVFTVDSIQNPGDYQPPGTVTFTLSTAAGGLVDEGTFPLAAGSYEAGYI